METGERMFISLHQQDRNYLLYDVKQRELYAEVMCVLVCNKKNIYLHNNLHYDKDYCVYCWDTVGYSKCHI